MVTCEKSGYKKGSQVYYNYGDRTNKTLLLDYGFALPENTNDVVKIRIRN